MAKTKIDTLESEMKMQADYFSTTEKRYEDEMNSLR